MGKRCMGSCCAPMALLPHLPPDSGDCTRSLPAPRHRCSRRLPSHTESHSSRLRVGAQAAPSGTEGAPLVPGLNQNLPWEQSALLTPPSSSPHPSLRCSHLKAGDQRTATTVAWQKTRSTSANQQKRGAWSRAPRGEGRQNRAEPCSSTEQSHPQRQCRKQLWLFSTILHF